jgi:acyl carrier protein
MSSLKQDIKQLIISVLELEDITVNDIEDDAPLFGEGLGLDSIDALELGVALKKKYQVKLEANDASTREHFRSVATLAQFVAQHTEAV